MGTLKKITPFFSIPADFTLSSLDRIAENNSLWAIPIREVYGSLNPSPWGTGREQYILPKCDLYELRTYVAACLNRNIEFNYCINLNCTGNIEFCRIGQKSLADFARMLVEVGVSRVTVTLPSIIETLQHTSPGLKVTVSVIASIDSINKLKYFTVFPNVDRIIVCEYLNRRIGALDLLVRNCPRGISLGTIINSLCLIDCPARSFHYSFGSHAINKTEHYFIHEYYGAKCALRKIDNPSEFLKMPWIRPEDLSLYWDLGISYFKLSGREMRGADWISVVDIYNQGSFYGNAIDLFMGFIDGPFNKIFFLPNSELGRLTARFFENPDLCDPIKCFKCNQCDEYVNLIEIDDEKKRLWSGMFSKDLQSFIVNL